MPKSAQWVRKSTRSPLRDGLASAVLGAFEMLGGDPSSAVEAAQAFPTPAEWISYQRNQVAVAGVGATLVPLSGFVTVPADVAFLFHKMAHTTWGIGHLMDARVLGKADFFNALDAWTLPEDQLPVYRAVSERTAQSADALIAATEAEPLGQPLAELRQHNPLVTYNLLHAYASGQIADQDALASAVAAGLQAAEAPQDFDPTLDVGQFGEWSLGMARSFAMNTFARLSRSLGMRVAAHLAGSAATKAIAGIIPVAGAVINGGFNAVLLKEYGASAERYYAHAIAEPLPADLLG
ncbi:MAG: hypothetical protein HC915_18545 [Anaerolineae bacterium]|nr:hypothetical protein [Anaerolineae bacterium]